MISRGVTAGDITPPTTRANILTRAAVQLGIRCECQNRALGIQARLMMLALATALPLVALAGAIGVFFVDAQTRQITRSISEEVKDMVSDVEDQINAIHMELKVLAELPSLQSGDLETFDRQLRAALKVYGTALLLIDANGQQILNTNRPFGDPLPHVFDPDLHTRIFATGKPQVSNLIIGATLLRPLISVGVPVFHNGTVTSVLTMGVDPKILSLILERRNFPPGWLGGIFDRNGIILARSRDLDKFLGKPVAPDLRQAIKEAPEGLVPNVTSDGIAVYSTFRRSSITGWTAGIGLPREAVDGPVRRAWMFAVGGGTVFLILSLALAWWMAQAIRRPVRALAAMTQTLGREEPIAPYRGGVRELNLVADGLRAAAAALARHREQLEETVALRTQELRAEAEARKQAQASLLQSQKMEAIGQLTGGIAHDFNNLLTVASGSLEMLEARISDERSLHLLYSTQTAMWRAAKLTKSLLAFARKQRLEPVLADLNSVVMDMDEMLRRSLGPSVQIRHAFADELWPVRIDIGQIETALLNIAINARDAMPRGGTLLFETANVTGCLPHEVAGRECVLISVHDTGTGMSADVVERAFEPFFTTKDIGRGTGLGLSMVFGVVHQSGGAVRLHSRLGSGTTVLIYLPRADCSALPAARGTVSARLPESAAARILVVDDDEAVRWVTVECLREIGCSVEEADSGRAALTLLEHDELFDLIVMDQVMPGLSGEDTVRMARRARPELKVLFLSGNPGCGEEGSSDIWLQKPFRKESLAQAISRVLQ
jgi:signal transduction histidine kinase/CheY-like chemotaxis protein